MRTLGNISPYLHLLLNWGDTTPKTVLIIVEEGSFEHLAQMKLVQMGVVQMGLVQMGVVQMGVVQMG